MPTPCVVIPWYRDHLLRYEQVSLERCISILGAYPIVIIKPATLKPTGLRDNFQFLKIESFPDHYFSSISSYNQLLLSDQFYARFAKYDYILIHQLDAFVFSDQLKKWCETGYDYIGAPWIPSDHLPTWQDKVRTAARFGRYRLKRALGMSLWNGGLPNHMLAVGNGGFSLRRVQKMREILGSLTTELAYDSVRNGLINEDILLTVIARRYLPEIKIPDIRTAAAFSWELHPKVCSMMNGGLLPFGCHAWNKLHRDDWRPIFQRLGYSLDQILAAPKAMIA